MRPPIDLALPSGGHWLVQMSPADRIPSHGTHAFATTYAIDFLPVDPDGRSLRTRAGWRSEPPQSYVGFGRPVCAPVAGEVVSVTHSAPDHDAPRGLSLVHYAITQRRRMAEGWPELAGNHLLIRADAVYVALCHLQCGSVAVARGDQVTRGQPVARCGNSGNSTEPHLHLQAMDGPDPLVAQGVPISFGGTLPHNGTLIEGT